MEKIDTILEKHDNFKYAQIRSIEELSDSSKLLTIVVQDDDGEDIDTVKIEFNDVKESRILANHVLSFLDMASGISIIKEHALYGFSVGNSSAMTNIHNSPMYIVSSEVKID